MLALKQSVRQLTARENAVAYLNPEEFGFPELMHDVLCIKQNSKTNCTKYIAETRFY